VETRKGNKCYSVFADGACAVVFFRFFYSVGDFPALHVQGGLWFSVVRTMIKVYSESD